MNYKQLGFKAGLEIHAQLNTGGKLFCRCEPLLRQDEPDFTIRRELRPMYGETGQIDVAALFERKKKKHYLYEGYNSVTCLVELDEAPPREIDSSALRTAFVLAKLMNCKTPDVIQVMRKTVVDGSNTSGFQRTLLAGYDGWIKVTGRKIGINYLILEEDAARRVAETDSSVTYRLDRLGIPMVEIVTAPDLQTPDQVKAVAEYIGMLVKSTGRAMGGLGSIRQDINVSIREHCRVELKGVQDLKLMQKYVDAEILRQQNSKKETPHVRNVKPDFSSKFLRPLPGHARMYPETDRPLISVDTEMIKEIKQPELLIDKQRRHETLLGKELANQLVHSEVFESFDFFVNKFKKLPPAHIASTLLSTGSEVRRKLGLEFFEPKQADFEYLLNQQNAGTLSLQATTDIFAEVAKGSKIHDAATKFKKLSHTELKKEIALLKAQFKNVPADKLKGILIGKLKDRADIKDIVACL